MKIDKLTFYSFILIFLLSSIYACRTSYNINTQDAQESSSNTAENLSDKSNTIETSKGVSRYDDSGNGIYGRMVTYRDKSMILATGRENGTIVMKVCINQEGQVSFVELNEQQTTIKNLVTLKNVLKAMWNYRYTKDENAPNEECGKFTITVDS